MLFQQIAANKRRTVLLLLVFMALLAVIGAAVGYLMTGQMETGLVLALVVGLVYGAIMVFQSTRVVMAMNRAREVTEQEFPDLYRVVEDMAMVARIPMPKVYVIDDPALNAFAAGPSPDKAAVAATTGLLTVMNREELEGVMAHEVSHIRNYDIRLATIALALASAISLLASMGSRLIWYGGGRNQRRDDRDSGQAQALMLVLALVTMALAPLAATLVQLAISRQREFLADAGAVELTRNPQGMIKALRKLDQSAPMSRPIDPASSAIYINMPKNRDGLQALFRTHPPIADRIARLERL